MSYNISNKQKEIIDYNDNEDILVIACPGSGKTHTIICKYIKIVTQNIYNPNEIILITFTKKAGNELLNRLSQFSILNSKQPFYVGTIHGLAYKILKKYKNINCTILDDSSNDYKNYIWNLVPLNQEWSSLIKSKILLIIDQISNNYPIDLKKVLIKNNLEKYYNEFDKIYKSYQHKKLKEKVIDFNDLMIMFCNFLKSEESNEFKKCIKYIFFDEYQDINPIQNYILDALNKNSTLMLVGDDAQSIYSFRGSNIDFILNYKKTVFLLEENYRSTSGIVNFCQNIISLNTAQIKKNVSSSNIIDNKPKLYQFENYLDLYTWLSKKIIKNTELQNLSDSVILSRTHNIL